MNDPRPDLYDQMADFAAEERERLPDVSLRDFLEYGKGRLEGEPATAVQDWLAADPRTSHLMLELKSMTQSPDLDGDPSEHEIEQEWRAFEASLDPKPEARPGRSPRWLAIAAILVLAAGWVFYLERVFPRASSSDEQGAVIFEELFPDVVRGGTQSQIEDSGSGFLVLKLLLPPSIDRGPVPAEVDYVLARHGAEVRRGRLILQDEEDFVLLLPRDLLPPGEYSIRLLNSTSDDQPVEELSDYQFQVLGGSL